MVSLSETPEDVRDRFFLLFEKYAEKGEKCWEWTGYKTRGYGEIQVRKQSRRYRFRAHRYAYLLFKGEIPDHLMVDHMCLNRGCVNPRHLRLVTNKQNLENRAYGYSSTGVRNVYMNKDALMVQVKHNQKIHRRYGFKTLDEAEAAAKALRLELFTHNELDRQEDR